MQKRLFSVLLLLLFSQLLIAQNPFFSYNLYRYNPAAAATSSEWATNVEYNTYTGIAAGTNQLDLNVQKRFSKFHSAIGFNAYTFKWAEDITFRRDYNLSYAYQRKLSHKDNSPTLSFGVQSGLSRRFVSYNNSRYNMGYFANLGISLFFSLPNQKFYAGIAANDIVKSKAFPSVEYLPYYQFMAGYRFRLSQKLSLQPNILLQQRARNGLCYPNILDANLQLQHKKWDAGLSYSTAFMGLNVGVCLAKRFHIRASYNYINSRLNNYERISNISLMFAYRSVK